MRLLRGGAGRHRRAAVAKGFDIQPSRTPSGTRRPAIRKRGGGNVDYTFQFGDVIAASGELLEGAWLTIQLSATAMLLGLIVAIACAMGKTAGPRPVRWLINAYIELIRNTPFLVQLFFIFFGAAGDRAALFRPTRRRSSRMVVNVGAYATEIIRAGIESIAKGQIEAGLALGLTRLQIFRFIVLKPALRAIYPALTSQFILLMLTSSIVSAISADELTSVADKIAVQTFRSFEIYIVVTGIYLALSLLFSTLFALIYRRRLQLSRSPLRGQRHDPDIRLQRFLLHP